MGKVKQKVTITVKVQSHMSKSTDFWFSLAQGSYLSLTAHFINFNLEREQAYLRAVPFDDSRIGERITSVITIYLKACSIAEKLYVFASDNGSNFVASLRDGDIPNIPCLGHTLQLVIKDDCLAQRCVSAFTAMIRKLILIRMSRHVGAQHFMCWNELWSKGKPIQLQVWN